MLTLFYSPIVFMPPVSFPLATKNHFSTIPILLFFPLSSEPLIKILVDEERYIAIFSMDFLGIVE